MFMLRSLPAICSGDKPSRSIWTHQLEALTARQQLCTEVADLAADLHLLLGQHGRVAAARGSVAAQLPADGRRGSADQAGNPPQAETLGTADLNGGAFFNAEFGIRHRAAPYRKGQVLHSVFAAAVRDMALRGGSRKNIGIFWEF